MPLIRNFYPAAALYRRAADVGKSRDGQPAQDSRPRAGSLEARGEGRRPTNPPSGQGQFLNRLVFMDSW